MIPSFPLRLEEIPGGAGSYDSVGNYNGSGNYDRGGSMTGVGV